MRRLRQSLLILTAATALLALPAVAANDQPNDRNVADYWLTSVDDSDVRAVGKVSMIDYPKFTLRTLDEGTMNFVIPETKQHLADFNLGERLQVWYDPNDQVNLVGSDEVWIIVHGFDLPVADLGSEQTATESKTLTTDDPQAVQNTALPPGAQKGPGAMSHTFLGEITDVNESSIVIDTVVGERIIRIVPQTQVMTDLEPGMEVAVEFHNGSPVIHAALIRGLDS